MMGSNYLVFFPDLHDLRLPLCRWRSERDLCSTFCPMCEFECRCFEEYFSDSVEGAADVEALDDELL